MYCAVGPRLGDVVLEVPSGWAKTWDVVVEVYCAVGPRLGDVVLEVYPAVGPNLGMSFLRCIVRLDRWTKTWDILGCRS